ncbi:mitogen-activated protein kinase kinase kinase [Malassezia yamatoensis]|uniref:Mitogen-activated protein kinase kinase kinase n=1 Tax=Malassezia yamatoensis TaxID=253288 RepID=A0AAJ5YU39_9BASI|nr:mitogen-activated protein kinase kinase kinase [Malassezia yamatoensis]
MAHSPRSTESGVIVDYNASPSPHSHYTTPITDSINASPPPMGVASDSHSNLSGGQSYGAKQRPTSIQHARNASSPGGLQHFMADSRLGSSLSASSNGHWNAMELGSPLRRPQAFPVRGTTGRMTGDMSYNASVNSQAYMRPSVAGNPRPFSSSSMHSHSSASSGDQTSTDRVLIQATLDNEHFSVVNVSGLDSAPAIKACILGKLPIGNKDPNQWGLARTEIGSTDSGSSPLIDDNTLLALCLQFGDDKGTIKFLVLPTRSIQPVMPLSSSIETRSTDVSRGRTSASPTHVMPINATLPWHNPHNPSSSFHEAMALGQWPVPTSSRRAPPNPSPSWGNPVSFSLRTDSQTPFNSSASVSNRPAPQTQRLMIPSVNLQPGMVAPSMVSMSSSHAQQRFSANEAPASLQPANPISRQAPSPPIGSHMPSTPAAPSPHTPVQASPRMDMNWEVSAAPPAYEQALSHSTSSHEPSPQHALRSTTMPSWPPLQPKARSSSHSSIEPHPVLATRASTAPNFNDGRSDSSNSHINSENRQSVYPLFKSEQRSDSQERRDAERGLRPLPTLPSPSSASASITNSSPGSIKPNDHNSGASHWDANAQRYSSSRDHGSSITTATSVSTPRSSTGEEEQRNASMQRVMQYIRCNEQRQAEATPLFDSFSDDTLGGTFAQPLDASTLRENDTFRPEFSAMNLSTGEATLTAHRPVLTLAISPSSETAAKAMPSSFRESGSAQQKHALIERRSSFADRDEQWAFRPPTEQLYEQLDELFPRHDLDKPLTDTSNTPSATDATKSATPISSGSSSQPNSSVQFTPKPARNLARSQHHSIRVIAQNRKRFLEKTKHVERRRATRDSSLLERRRSTKLWGGRMVEMRTNGPESVGLVPDTTVGPEVEPNARPVFKWVKGDLIGKGTFGRVYLALNATTGEMIAVKQVELPQTSADRDSSRQRDVVAALRSEIETLKDLDHPNVVTCLGFEQTSDTLSIFLEYVPGGSIGSCLRKHGKFDEDTVSSFLNQTLHGLAYLHKQGILHRDLKADNLLVDFQGTCKISDFGTVRRSDDIYSNVENMSLQGSIFWMAPEVVGLSRKGYSAKVDIWSLGCVVLEMLAGRRPWSDEEAIQAMFKIGAERRAPPIPADCKPSKPAAHFLRNCFEIDPDRRPTASRLLEHVFAWPSPDYSFEKSALYTALHTHKPSSLD